MKEQCRYLENASCYEGINYGCESCPDYEAAIPTGKIIKKDPFNLKKKMPSSQAITSILG